VPVTPLSGFVDNSGSALWGGEPGSLVHTPGYTIDADKIAIFEGSIRATVAQSTTANIFTATGLTPGLGVHEPCAWTGGWGYCRIGMPNGALGSGTTCNLGMAMAVGQMFSLANFIWLDSTSPLQQQRIPISMVNSWGQYSGWPTVAASRTPDGLCLMHGLMSAGTVGSIFTNVPQLWRPRFSAIMNVASNAAPARVDVGLGQNSPSASVNNGSNVWVSLDGICWPAYT
jgi:hypothetical protein